MANVNKTEEPLKERMLQAERALADYFRGFSYDPEQERMLADAARSARDEYVDQLNNLWPGRYKLPVS